MSLANAILQGTPQQVSAMLDAGVDLDDYDEDGFTPLIEAAIAQRPEMLQLLIAAGADVNFADLAGRTALHWCVENSDIASAKCLLEAGANPNSYTNNAEPTLVISLLREDEDMKSLLYQYGADLNFAKDYIFGKLTGHRFELTGHNYLATNDGKFILLDMEGFFLEFSVNVIRDSLSRFKSNFAAKHLKPLFDNLHFVIDSLQVASELITYQQYTTDLAAKDARINQLLQQPLLLIPATYQGHAITFIRFGHFFAKCDRGANSEFEGSVVIYRMTNPQALTTHLLKEILYKKHSDEFMHSGINQQLGLQRLINFPVGPQITGNCSWANVEAAVPTMLFLLLLREEDYIKNPSEAIRAAVNFHHEWHEWDKDRALEQCFQDVDMASDTRQASKILLLMNILFQTCDFTDDRNVVRAERIIKCLRKPEYRPYLDNYLKVYYHDKITGAGQNLMHLFDIVK